MSLKILVTGTNKGIGLELVRQLADKGHTVFAACRKTSDSLENINLNGGCILPDIDVSQDDTCEKLKTFFKGKTIDWCINNSGILTVESLDDLNYDNMRKQFEVNTLGPLRVVQGVQDSLVSGSKIFIITSRMGSMDDNSSGSMYGYRISKAAVNMVGKNLAVDLQPKGISVMLLHPGMVATDMTARWGGGISTQESANGLITRMESSSLETTGKFFHQDGQELPW
jgi:NAD(P)-dependent dehydrogenase (short-subunit alcohol dehydrogenase family)